MAYFIRRYQKGIAKSGTKDIFSSDSEIPISMFCSLAEHTGPGKYLLGERGKGIRGFRKITEFIVPTLPATQIFAAEDDGEELEDSMEEAKEEVEDKADEMSEELVEKREAATMPTPAPKEVVAQPREQISVRHNKKLEDMTNDELTDLLGGMSQTQLSAETVATFQADLARVHAEMQSRGMLHGTKEAETSDRVVIGTGFSPWAAFGIGGVVGLAVGVLGSMTYYKKKMDEINVKLAEMDASIKEAESTIGRQERRILRSEEEKEKKPAPQPRQRDPIDLDLQFLSSYNATNGRLYE